MKNLTVREYHKFQLEQYIYQWISPSCKNQGAIWLFFEEGMFWYPNVEFVYFPVINDRLMPKTAGMAFSQLVCSKMTWKYYDCLPRISDFWANYYAFLKEYAERNFSEMEQNQIFFFLKKQGYK